jgi:hypothetical protein
LGDTGTVNRNIPSRSRRRKWALHLKQVLVPSLWFRACRWRCSDLENDFPHDGWLQQNFFLISEYFELDVELEEMEDDLEVAGAMAI